MKKLTLEQMEEFTGKSVAHAGEPRISLQKSGRIGINRAADNLWFQNFSHVTLFWDSKSRVIALKLLKKPESTSYEVKRTKSSSIYISCQAFFNYIGLPKDQGIPSEIIEFNEKENALFLRLL
jgi:hypothetical protein